MYQSINEKVKVLAAFDNGKVTPKIIKWGVHTLKIDKVNLDYQERDGSSINYYFAVDTNRGETLKLRYNNEKMDWVIEESWTE